MKKYNDVLLRFVLITREKHDKLRTAWQNSSSRDFSSKNVHL